MVGPKSKEPAGHDELKSAKAQEQSVLTAQTSVVFEFEPNPSFVSVLHSCHRVCTQARLRASRTVPASIISPRPKRKGRTPC